MKLSHLDQAGRARMVDVGDKPVMDRTAVATGTIRMSREAFQQVADQAVAKGDVLAVSEVAGTLTAVAVALLTVYDMVKAVDAAMVIADVQLVEKKKAPRPD